MLRYISHSARETEQLGRALADRLRPGDVIAYRGGMGMGKTVFTRGLADGLGVPPEEVSSPTFALVHEHLGRMPFYHFDMYRIDGFDDLYSTGFFDYLDQNGVLAVEWSENIADALAGLTPITVTISPGEDEDTREITIEGDERF